MKKFFLTISIFLLYSIISLETAHANYIPCPDNWICTFEEGAQYIAPLIQPILFIVLGGTAGYGLIEIATTGEDSTRAIKGARTFGQACVGAAIVALVPAITGSFAGAPALQPEVERAEDQIPELRVTDSGDLDPNINNSEFSANELNTYRTCINSAMNNISDRVHVRLEIDTEDVNKREEEDIINNFRGVALGLISNAFDLVANDKTLFPQGGTSRSKEIVLARINDINAQTFQQLGVNFAIGFIDTYSQSVAGSDNLVSNLKAIVLVPNSDSGGFIVPSGLVAESISGTITGVEILCQ